MKVDGRENGFDRHQTPSREVSARGFDSRRRWVECSWRSIVRKMHAATSSENEEVLCVTRETWKDLVRPGSERSMKYSRMIDEALGTSLADPEGVR